MVSGLVYFFDAHERKRKMPIAGPDPFARKLAHMKWAQRYNERGDVSRVLAHFGRALEYSDMASFGVY